MALTRRGFLGLTTAALAGFALDPERSLWVKGAKTIFLPPTTVLAAEADEMEYLLAGIGGPWLLPSWRHDGYEVWAHPADPTTLLRTVTDQEYRLLVDRGRKILAHRKTVVGATELPPYLRGDISKAEAAVRWPVPRNDPQWAASDKRASVLRGDPRWDLQRG
jgi:hypothetical protein